MLLCIVHALGESFERLLRLHGELSRLRIGLPVPANGAVPAVLARSELPTQGQIDLVGRRHGVATATLAPRAECRSRRASGAWRRRRSARRREDSRAW